jgi:hypothetical protein
MGVATQPRPAYPPYSEATHATQGSSGQAELTRTLHAGPGLTSAGIATDIWPQATRRNRSRLRLSPRAGPSVAQEWAQVLQASDSQGPGKAVR